MRRCLLTFLVAIFCPVFVFSTHIIGGSLTYEHLGGSTYRIKLKLYRDCDPANADFPSSVRIEVRQSNGSSFSPDKDIIIPLVGRQVLDPFIDTCVIDPGICVEEALFTTIVNNLPPVTGGYHMFYQICCRNASLVNVPVTPFIPGTGESFYAFIPENDIWLTNSSPEWVNFPPVFICASQPFIFDHAATDIDGDSLVYDLYHPWEDEAPTFPGGVATFPTITYNPGYTYDSPLDPVGPPPTMFIDAQTGLLTTTPPMIGQFVVGVKVSEYRDGVLLSSVYRDFQFNVVVCPPPATAAIGPSDACNGNSVVFDNASSPTAQNFFWDFGDLTSTTDTSYSDNPSYTYPGIGTYTVMLIAQQGTPCADTTYRDITIGWADADFTSNEPVCVSSPVIFTDASTASINSSITDWYWDFGDGSGTSTLPNPSYTYGAGGTYDVWLYATNDFGCVDSIMYTVTVQDLPIADAGNDTIMCLNNSSITLAGAVYNASGGLWVGDSTFLPNASTLNADYTPSAAELAAGYAEVILTTTGSGLCPATSDTMIITIVPGPTSDAGPTQILVCEDTTYVPLTGAVTIAAGGTWTTTGGGTFSPDPDSLNVNYNVVSSDTAAGSIWVYLTTTGNGSCLSTVDSAEIVFTPAPNLVASAPDTACEADHIQLNGFSETGSGFWTTLGNGTFDPGDSLLNTYYVPGPADIAAGQVTVILTSTNNGGCLPQTDTLVIDLIPAPTPSFNFTEVCFGEQTFFSDGSTSVGFITNWEWDMGDGAGTSTLPDPIYTYGAPGSYDVSLVVTSNNGCRDTLTQTVDVHYLPEPGFWADGVCLNAGTIFNDTSVVADGSVVSWDWNFGDGVGSDTAQNPTYMYTADGTYNVQLTVTSDWGCVDSITLPINVLPGPDADFTESNSSVNIFENIVFTDQSTPPPPSIIDWFWDFGDTIGTSNVQNPTYSYDASGTYTVMLVVTDDNGCMDTTYRDIIVFLPPEIPNAFTPNGDGVNDILYILGGPFKELEYKIYNNWGELIFVSTSQDVGWDGTFDGIDQPIGVYVVTAVAVTEDDVVHELQLDVTLLR